MKSPDKIKILIGPSSFGKPDPLPLDKLKEAGFNIINNPFGRKLTKQELLDLLPGIEGLIAGLEMLDEEVMNRSDLKVISRCGSGLSNVDLNAADRLGIKICSTPQGPVTAVAELTIGALLNLFRMISFMDKEMHEGKWTKKIGTQLEGKTVLIIGVGRIGRKVASLLKSFNVKIIGVDPNISEEPEDIEILPLEKALPEADVITLHLSGEKEIIGEKEFKLVKNGVYLLNVARGGMVNEEALIKALDNGKIAGAWLDTFSAEPYTGQLRKYPQVVLTPHVGSYTAECRRSMEMEAVNNLISTFKEV